MKKSLLSLILGIGIGLSSIAQVSEGGFPTSFEKVIAGESSVFDQHYQIHSLNAPDMLAVALEDESNDDKGNPYRVGINIPVDLNMMNSGTWLELENGDKIWRLGIEIPYAQALGLYFSENVVIPAGGKLHAYNRNHAQYIGAYTVNTPQFMAMEMIQGDLITLEYYMPAGSTQLPTINISEIAYFYRGADRMQIFADADAVYNQKTHQSCEVDVACSEGSAWTDQINSVVRYTFVDGGTYLCSGSVINNTNNDCTPYILSANHCGEPVNNSDITGHVWYFNYQRPSCVPGTTAQYTGAMSQTMSGGYFRASSSLGNYPGSASQVDGSDFVLVEMTSQIPSGYNAYYGGWSRATTGSPSGVGIHHPAGDEKKISTYSSSLSSSTYNGGWSGAHWLVTWVATANGHGVTEGGSSGSPIFNNSGRVVGHLSGGSSYCSTPTSPDLYGKFNRAWDQEGTAANCQLEPWLDPGGTGAMTLDGTYQPCGPAAPVADFVADQTTVLPATTVNFTDLSSNTPTSWTWSVSPGTGWSYAGGTNASSQNPQITFNTLGFYTVSLTATNAIGSDTETKNNYIEVTNVVGPCTAAGNADCSTGNANEYISRVTLNTIDNASSCSDYTDYTSISTTLTKGSSYDVFVEPAVMGTGTGTAYTNDEIAVWIDFNGDNDFNDAGEDVGYVLVSGTFSSTFNFTVPTTAVTGSVIMRCRISYQPDGAIDPCGTSSWGEVEDYTINIVAGSGGSAPVANFTASQTTVPEGTVVNFTDLSTNSPTSWSWSVSPATGWTYSGGTTASSQNPSILFSTAGTYTVALTATNATGSDTETKTNYITVTVDGSGLVENGLDKISIYPNPTSNQVTVNLSGVTVPVEQIELSDITGRVIAIVNGTNANVVFDLANETSGVYFIKVNSADATVTRKVVKL